MASFMTAMILAPQGAVPESCASFSQLMTARVRLLVNNGAMFWKKLRDVPLEEQGSPAHVTCGGGS